MAKIVETIGEIKEEAEEEISDATIHIKAKTANEGALTKALDDAATAAAAKGMADVIFHGDSKTPHRSIQVAWVDPSVPNKMDAMKVSAFMRDYFYVPPRRTPVPSEVPGGKLRMRQAMERSAQQHMGTNVTAKPWVNTQINHHPPLAIDMAMALDQSYSMHSIINRLTGAAWSIANAVQPFDSRFAAVTFGSQVAPLVSRGTTMNKVPHIVANAPHEAAGTAFQALDGELGLSHPNKRVKVLLIFSDGEWVHAGHSDHGDAELDRLRAAGVKTFMIYTDSYIVPHGCEPVIMGADDWVGTFINVLRASV